MYGIIWTENDDVIDSRHIDVQRAEKVSHKATYSGKENKDDSTAQGGDVDECLSCQ